MHGREINNIVTLIIYGAMDVYIACHGMHTYIHVYTSILSFFHDF